MGGRRKIIKKKLKEPDEFISFSEQAFIFVKGHLRTIATGGMILLLILLSIFLFQKWEEKKEADAYQKFDSAMEGYVTLNSPNREASISEYKNLLEKFDEVVKEFPRTSSGKFSLLYIGNLHLHLGEFDEAIKAYQAFLQKAGKEKLYRYFGMEGLGYAYEEKKDYEKALEAYQKILEIGDRSQMAEPYLEMGRCYEKLGKKKEALDNYKAFLKASPKSMMTNVILEKVSNLEN
jgi:tetratricopeptide (TPR) repeat protein